MKIGEENMLKRWRDLSDYEKWGYEPAFMATEILHLLEDLVEEGRCRKLTETQERILFGFEVNTGFGAEDGFSFLHCLDLHSVAINKNFFSVSELDSYFMDYVKVNGISFWDRWLDEILRNK